MYFFKVFKGGFHSRAKCISLRWLKVVFIPGLNVFL